MRVCMMCSTNTTSILVTASTLILVYRHIGFAAEFIRISSKIMEFIAFIVCIWEDYNVVNVCVLYTVNPEYIHEWKTMVISIMASLVLNI